MNRDVQIGVPLTPIEKKTIRQAAELLSQAPAAFCRSAAMAEARRVLRDHLDDSERRDARMPRSQVGAGGE